MVGVSRSVELDHCLLSFLLVSRLWWLGLKERKRGRERESELSWMLAI